MRLRQAHAILEAATALEAVTFDHSQDGFEFHPFDHDTPDAIDPPRDDYMTGFAEFNDPDHPNDHTRTYNIDIKPSPTDTQIVVRLVFGYGPEAEPLIDRSFNAQGGDPERFQAGLGAHIADLVVSAVREHEEPHEAAYAVRAAASGPELDGYRITTAIGADGLPVMAVVVETPIVMDEAFEAKLIARAHEAIGRMDARQAGREDATPSD